MTTTVAVILAGGSARRMGGGDKPLLAIDGRPMIAHILTALDGMPAAINANGDPARFAGFGLAVLADSFIDQGPLAGVLAGLDWAATQGAETLLTIPGDTPFIPRGLAVALSPAPACATSLGRVHHLVALWPVCCRDDIRSVLSMPGPRNVVRFAERLGMRHLAFAPERYDPFMNVNTPEDLAAAEAVAAERKREGL